MPAQFKPTHATAIILFGHEACSNFVALLEYWNGVLEKKAWDRYLFVLIDTQEFDSTQIPAEIKSSCWSVNPESIQNGGRPEVIINEIRKRIENCKVLLQFVFSLQEDAAADPDAIIAFLRSIQNDFVQGHVITILYMILHDQAALRERQNAFAEKLYANREFFPFIYLLGSRAEDDSIVSHQTMWRAISGELLAHSATERVLQAKGLYSLGLSTLNANNGELEAIRFSIISEWIAAQVSEPVSQQSAWRMFTQSDTSCPQLTPQNVSPVIKRRLEQVVRRYTKLPGMVSRVNNRRLASLYTMQQREVEKAIGRFYQINVGSKAEQRNAAQRYMNDFVDGFIKDLQKTYNAQAFPMSFLECVKESLQALKVKPPKPKFSAWPHRRTFTAAGKNQYIDQQCMQIESVYEQYAIVDHISIFAEAWIQELERVEAFIQNAAGLSDVQRENQFTAYEIERLKDKYENYTEAVQNAIKKLHGRSIFGEMSFEYFRPDGIPRNDNLQDVSLNVDQTLRRNLPHECNGSFCAAVSWECASPQGLNTFFGEYLGGSKRMLYEPMDGQGSRDSLYYSDVTLATHAWFNALTQEIIIAHNDNVERVDLFTLQKDLLWYRDNNRNFKVEEAVSKGSFYAHRLGDSQEKQPADKAPSPSVPLDEDSEKTKEKYTNPHNLNLTITRNYYVLSWDWQPGIDVATINVYQNENRVAEFICTIDEYFKPIDGMRNGMDISSGLPYGRIHVIIQSQKGVYARCDMAGRKNEVQYDFKRGKNSHTLLVKGSASDVNGLVLNVDRNEKDERPVRYPLSASGDGYEHIFKNIMEINPDQCSLIPAPEERFPTVYATRIHE